MSLYLLDTNVLLALMWPKHRHYAKAHACFDSTSPRWATCPLTECGFVRVISNPAFDPYPLKPGEAIAVLKQNLAHPRHVFWPDNLQLCDSPHFPVKALRGHQQITDA